MVRLIALHPLSGCGFRSCHPATPYGSSDVTLLIAFEIPPDSAVKATIAPMVITARTTPYSAIVWPSSLRHFWRAKSSHQEMNMCLFTSSRVSGPPRSWAGCDRMTYEKRPTECVNLRHACNPPSTSLAWPRRQVDPLCGDDRTDALRSGSLG